MCSLSEPTQLLSALARSSERSDTSIDFMFDILGERVYPVLVATIRTGVSQPWHDSRPRLRAAVIADLAVLRGPSRGPVELPLWLYWSHPDHAFDLDDRDMRLWLYQTVLREAGRPEDLAEYLDRETLIGLWPDLHLPKSVRQAWEKRHPVLRDAAAVPRQMIKLANAVDACVPCGRLVRGYPPAMHEICDELGLTLPSRIPYQCSSLPGKQVARRRDVGRPWTTEGRLYGHPALRLQADDLATSSLLFREFAAYVIAPVIGRIPAGGLNLAEVIFEDAFLLARQITGAGALFMLKVSGDSMINAAISDSDWVVIRQQNEARNGDIVAAMVGHEVTVKTYKEEDGHVQLMPQNPAYEPIAGDEATILGKVVGVVRQMS
jgi:repressor LexA